LELREQLHAVRQRRRRAERDRRPVVRRAHALERKFGAAGRANITQGSKGNFADRTERQRANQVRPYRPDHRACHAHRAQAASRRD
jgi:hypothetical protein